MLTNVTVFNKWAYTAVSEALAQEIALFNEATNGAIILRNDNNTGDFSDETFWKDIAGLVRRRDPYSNADVTPIDLNMIVDTMVRVAGGTPPVNIPPVMFTWIGMNPEEGAVRIAQQLAPKIMQDMVNTAVAALAAALRQTGTTQTDVSGDTAPANLFNPANLNKGKALFGDRSSQIVCWVVHSKPMHDYYGNALANAQNLYRYETVNVMVSPFGERFVMSDIPGLVVAGTPNDYINIGLVAGAAIVERNNDFYVNIDTRNGGENIRRTYQAEWSFNLGLRGYSWDKTNGGKAPTNSTLAVGTNWDMTVTSFKDLPGVIVRTQ